MPVVQFRWEECQRLWEQKARVMDLAILEKGTVQMISISYVRTLKGQVALLRLRLSRSRGLALVAGCLSCDVAEP